jgi:glycosyltransferase involved in cell wall biosynthesis
MSIPTLQVCPALAEGGVERSTVDMALFLKKKGIVPHVASAGGTLTAELTEAGLPHHCLPLHRKNPLTLLLNAGRLARLIRQNHIRLVHARSRAPAWSAWLACKITGVPFITTFHGTYGLKGPGKKFYNAVMTWGLYTIANSTFIRDHILAHYRADPARLLVAPRGYNARIFDPNTITPATQTKLRQTLELEADTPVILMVGRLTRWKGQHILLQALTRIADLPWVALFAGGASKHSPYQQELLDYSRKHDLAARVRWLGSRTDTPALYTLSDITVSASIEPEAFGRVAVESQAMQTPVIATAHGGSLETVQDGITGWLIPPGEVEILAETLREALTHPQNLAKMGTAARQWVSHHFTTQQTCEREFDAYRHLLNLSQTKEK